VADCDAVILPAKTRLGRRKRIIAIMSLKRINTGVIIGRVLSSNKLESTGKIQRYNKRPRWAFIIRCYGLGMNGDGI
jgi:hypothetical protein